MKTFFGVNSTAHANKRLKNGYTLFDWVMRQRCFPSFWMRTLLGEDAISEEEINYLRGKNCKIGLVVRDLTEAGISGISGVEDAFRAVDAARVLGVPQDAGIAIFAEIKPEWSVNHNWMISFASIVESAGFVPGFIGNTDSSINFNFDRQCSHFVQATADTNQFGAIYCATEPRVGGMPDEWAPHCPSALEPEDILLWECGTIPFDGMKVEEIYAKCKKVLDFMW